MSVPDQTPPADEAPGEGPLPGGPDSSPPATRVEDRAPVHPAIAAGFGDVLVPLTVEIGSGTLTVREVIELRRSRILRMAQSAGEDLSLIAHDVSLARGEVVIIEDSTAVRVTEIARVPGADMQAPS